MSLIRRGVEVWEGFGVVWRARSYGSPEGFEGGHGGDPWGDGGGEVFGQEWAEGLGFPGLEVAGGPVVEEADAEDVVGGLFDGNR